MSKRVRGRCAFGLVAKRINKHREHGYGNKAYFPTKELADKKIEQFEDEESMNSYPCPFCRGWHIGHKHGTRNKKRN